MKINLLYLNLLLFIPFLNNAQSVTILEENGWLESAFVTWNCPDSVDSYNVYYSGEGFTNINIDNQLIRNYGNYYRADIPGLKAGNYTIKINPVIDGVEKTGTETSEITVIPNDRTGFAFSNNRTPGAYNADGTEKDNAVILYVTENNKDKISLDVTGANENPCVGLQNILEGFKKGKDTRPLIVRMIGKITDLDYLDKGDIVIENKKNSDSYITIEGIGNDAVAYGWGIRIKNAANVEIRNIGLMNTDSKEGDDIGLQQNNEYIWIHNCDFFYGEAGGDSDQNKGDGALDCKKSTYVTFSYNHFWDTGKSNLLGLGENSTTGWYITYHHNWYDHSDSRHPRVRYYSAHVYNNYYDGNSKYGVGSTLGSSVFVEGNYFRNCKYPMLISMQGSDVYDQSSESNDYSDMPTFSKEDGGIIKAYNNYMTGQKRFVAYGDDNYPQPTTDFDAYVAQSRDEKIGNTVVSASGNNSYNNFDTDEAIMYDYTVDSPETAKKMVTDYAGRVAGGDFSWTFDNDTDDASYALNKALKDSLDNYQTDLVSIQGDSTSSGNDTIVNPSTDPSDMVHNFTDSGTNSTFYSISGNLSDSKGTVTYQELTLTQCLKIESSTSISFTSTETGVFTLVFKSDFSGKIKINGTDYSATNGIVSITLPAGSYEITKNNVAYLFYMSLVYNSTNINDIENQELKLYPNPVNNLLNISNVDNIMSIEIYSVSGKLIRSTMSVEKTIDTSGLNKGTYIVKLYTLKGNFTQKIIKK